MSPFQSWEWNRIWRPFTCDVPIKPTAFCEDANHEIIVLDWMDKAWRVVAK